MTRAFHAVAIPGKHLDEWDSDVQITLEMCHQTTLTCEQKDRKTQGNAATATVRCKTEILKGLVQQVTESKDEENPLDEDLLYFRLGSILMNVYSSSIDLRLFRLF